MSTVGDQLRKKLTDPLRSALQNHQLVYSTTVSLAALHTVHGCNPMHMVLPVCP